MRSVEQVFHIPIGVSRGVSDGVVHSDYTMATVARDPQNLRYYYKTYDDQAIRMIDLKLVSTAGRQSIVDMSAHVK